MLKICQTACLLCIKHIIMIKSISPFAPIKLDTVHLTWPNVYRYVIYIYIYVYAKCQSKLYTLYFLRTFFNQWCTRWQFRPVIVSLVLPSYASIWEAWEVLTVWRSKMLPFHVPESSFRMGPDSNLPNHTYPVLTRFLEWNRSCANVKEDLALPVGGEEGLEQMI